MSKPPKRQIPTKTYTREGTSDEREIQRDLQAPDLHPMPGANSGLGPLKYFAIAIVVGVVLFIVLNHLSD